MMMCKYGHESAEVPSCVFVLTDGKGRSSYGPDPFVRIHGASYAKVSPYDVLIPLLPLEYFT